MNFNFLFRNKGEASAAVKQLPDEMIKYELETQCVRGDVNFFKRKKQLSDLLESRKYQYGRQTSSYLLQDR